MWFMIVHMSVHNYTWESQAATQDLFKITEMDNWNWWEYIKQRE